MISARRAAALGLTAPLSAIMIALLGLWPEQDDPPDPDIPPAFVEVGGGMTQAKADRLMRKAEAVTKKPPEDDYDNRRYDMQNLTIMTVAAAAMQEFFQ